MQKFQDRPKSGLSYFMQCYGLVDMLYGNTISLPVATYLGQLDVPNVLIQL